MAVLLRGWIVLLLRDLKKNNQTTGLGPLMAAMPSCFHIPVPNENRKRPKPWAISPWS